MKLTKLVIDNIRNHKHTNLILTGGLNIFYGCNGSGKTTILETTSICGFSKTFLPASDSALISAGESYYRCFAEASSDLLTPYRVGVEYKKGARKQIWSSLGDNLTPRNIIGEMPIVVLSPDFRAITAGSPKDRREFMDRILSQISKNYIDDILTLKRCLKQRNILFQNAKINGKPDFNQIDSWTELLARTSANLVERRTKFVSEFIPFFKDTYEMVSNGREQVSIEYLPDGVENDCDRTNSSLLEAFRKLAKQILPHELKRGATLFGPQKDELKITINNGVAKDFASQGQHKSLLVSLKFAEFTFLKSRKKETPLFLLDDIFSELDRERAEKVISLVSNSKAQTLLTATDDTLLREIASQIAECSFFEVKNGLVELKNKGE